jgi:hypothetical protein
VPAKPSIHHEPVSHGPVSHRNLISAKAAFRRIRDKHSASIGREVAWI